MPGSSEVGQPAIFPDPVERITVQEQVYRRIRDLIMSGGIEAGQSLTIPAIADAFSVSHMPVREALNRLVAERALTVISGRTVGVPQLSVERLEELRRIRVEVEGLAVAWACEKMTPETIRRLEGQVALMDKAIATGDVNAFLRINTEFHFTIYSAAGSPVLLSIIESLWLQISPYFGALYPLGDYPRSNREHAAILSAIRQGAPEAAKSALAADIDGAAGNLNKVLRRAVEGDETAQARAGIPVKG
jgi:DNA-binding GntR family transcriptional regulator